MLVNFRNGLMAGKRLPYDAEVEYLESTGTQWIDTGFLPPNDVDFYCRLSQTVANTGFAFGQVWNAKSCSFRRSSNTAASFYTSTGTVNVTIPSGWTLEQEYIIEKKGLSASVSIPATGQEYYNSLAKYTNAYPNETVCLFSTRNGDFKGRYRISQLKFSVDGTILHDFIPVRFTNEQGVSEGAMFDRANPTVGMNPDGSARTDGLYRNRDTGAFLYGSDT